MKRQVPWGLKIFILLTMAIFCISSFYRFNINRVGQADTGSSGQAADSINAYSTKGTVNTGSQNKKKQYIVVVDAGHGGVDAGAMGPSKSKEKDNTLAVALKLGKDLEDKGIKVIYTRKSDKTNLPADERPNLEARTAISNNAGADLFISIHNNSSTYASISGVETYYFGGSAKSKQLAGTIQSQIVSSLKLKDRGIRAETFYVLRNTAAPSVLVELGYITNKNEESVLKGSAYQDKYAQAITAAILKYLNIK
ncbi:MAG: N-acetylmuramoyl-L-alanine amidase [Bacillota bacterium]|nr:N-acetylmuramoyl-L-alanine amidase [Bacillota bacterium]